MLPTRRKDRSSIGEKIIAINAKGLSARQISDTIEDIWGFEVREGMLPEITDRFPPQTKKRQRRPLSAVFPLAFTDHGRRQYEIGVKREANDQSRIRIDDPNQKSGTRGK
ncbi:MAG: transposase [Eubacteriaceae bacterium]|nr:transposase [Eubacteriaceae bacterium]